ncbi:MAG: DNA gyrase (subunit A), partial [Candidatus Berkelbacteria bacterium Licking1014_2]
MKDEEQLNNHQPAVDNQYGTIKPRTIEDEMRQSYLDYAMSVIVSRALPDVRDGLKPVHRRIIYAMGTLGLTAAAKYRKSATVVGEVLGKYHPHGDIPVYDSLVRMAQDFSMRYRLVDGQGNFGSVDGDAPAAMRYTEAKLTKLAEELLVDIDKETVDFVANYDETREEPTVLPSRLPGLLLNGTTGIAVGMATSIPPHNLREVCQAAIALIDEPNITIDNLLEYVQGPDFPTGGNIYNWSEIKAAYHSGRGRILVRGTANIEENKNGFKIVISEIPYMVNKADLVAKIAELVKDKKIDGVSDLRDESDREAGVRIVLDLKSVSHPQKILNRLYELTNLQSVFHMNLLALVDGLEPRVLNLKEALEEFLRHRQIVVRRRTKFELRQAEERCHILEGLKKALDHIDAVIETIKKSADRPAANAALMEKFELTEKQSQAILEMRLAQLAALEQQKIEDELKEKQELILRLKEILGDEKEILRIIKQELEELIRLYGDERKTKVFRQTIGKFSDEDLIPNEQVFVVLTKDNYIKRVAINTYRSQGRGGRGVVGMATKETDTVEQMLTAMTHDEILFFTDAGRVFNCRVYDLPQSSRQAKGSAIVNVLQISGEEKVTAMIGLDKNLNYDGKYFLMATANGVVKKTAIEEYRNIRKSGIFAINLKNNDKLRWVLVTDGKGKLIVVSREGMSIYFNETDARPVGRTAAGVRGIRLRQGDNVIAADVIGQDEEGEASLLTILENGFGKRTEIKLFKVQLRGGIGIRASRVSNKTGRVVDAMVVYGNDGDMVLMSQKGQVIRMPLKQIKKLGRDTQGVTLMRLKKNDKVASMALFKSDGGEVATVASTVSTESEPSAASVASVKDNEGSESTNEPNEPNETNETNKTNKTNKTDATVSTASAKNSKAAPSTTSTPSTSPTEPNYWGN